jgi:hypothetical protein
MQLYITKCRQRSRCSKYGYRRYVDGVRDFNNETKKAAFFCRRNNYTVHVLIPRPEILVTWHSILKNQSSLIPLPLRGSQAEGAMSQSEIHNLKIFNGNNILGRFGSSRYQAWVKIFFQFALCGSENVSPALGFEKLTYTMQVQLCAQ